MREKTWSHEYLELKNFKYMSLEIRETFFTVYNSLAKLVKKKKFPDWHFRTWMENRSSVDIGAVDSEIIFHKYCI